MRITPFYSVFLGMAVEPLWHDSDACQIGLSIAPAERRPGEGHLRKHCQYCQLLNQPYRAAKESGGW